MATALDGSAIRDIERLVEAKDLIIVTPQEARGVYFIRKPDGTLERHRAELDPANFTVRDLDGLGRAILEGANSGEAVAVFVDDHQAVLNLETGDGTHRWAVTLPLPTHPAFEIVQGWILSGQHTQKALLRLLRTQLSRYADATVIAKLGSLKFTDNREGSSQVGPSQSGLSRSVQQKVSSENGTDIPEYLLLRVPVYDIPEGRDDTYEVKVFLEYDFEESVFVLAPVTDDVRAAREEAVQQIITHLRKVSGNLTVLYGQPK